MEKVIEVVNSSPALTVRSEHYPPRYQDRVPLKVKATRYVTPDLPFIGTASCIREGEYYVWVNSHGAVAAIMEDGEKLGLKPDEFEVIESHKESAHA